MRKTYLDNIRWITIILVVIYHVIYMFNSVQTAGVIGPLCQGTQYQDVYQYIVYPWFMVLLFAVSGMSARYSLERYTNREFIRRRTTKLLIPSTMGLFVFQWILGYFNMQIGGAFAQMPALPKPVLFLIMSVSGIGPLWFIQMLWLYSVLLVWIRMAERDRLYRLCSRADTAVLVAMTLVIWASAQVLNTPVVVVYRFGIYGAAFFIGYFVLSHEEVMCRLEKAWVLLTVFAAALMVIFCVVNWQKPYAEHSVLDTALCNIYAWIAVLAILACMHRFGNFDNAISRFMKQQAWGLYVFHYLPLAACAWVLHNTAEDLPAVMTYILTAVSAFAGALALNALVSKIPLLRWCVLGISQQRRE